MISTTAVAIGASAAPIVSGEAAWLLIALFAVTLFFVALLIVMISALFWWPVLVREFRVGRAKAVTARK